MNKQELAKVKSVVRNIPDFPVPGIQFKDLTTAFKDPEALQIMTSLVEQYGYCSEGETFGSNLATQLGAGFVPVRKPGKLPAEVIQKTYTKEYGTDTIEVHRDAITADDVVVIHDDLLATGGTMLAAYELVKSMNPKKIYINFICDLADLHGRDVFPEDVEVTSLFTF